MLQKKQLFRKNYKNLLVYNFTQTNKCKNKIDSIWKIIMYYNYI